MLICKILRTYAHAAHNVKVSSEVVFIQFSVSILGWIEPRIVAVYALLLRACCLPVSSPAYLHDFITLLESRT